MTSREGDQQPDPSPPDVTPDEAPASRDPEAPGLGAVAPDDQTDVAPEPNEPA